MHLAGVSQRISCEAKKQSPGLQYFYDFIAHFPLTTTIVKVVSGILK
jgi:hypothetical protein